MTSAQHLSTADAAALGVLAGLLVATVVGVASARRAPAIAQRVIGLASIALSLGWVVVDTPYEGPTLWTPLPGHGITIGDLLAVPATAVAVVLLVSSGRRRITPPSVSEAARRQVLARVG